MKIKTDYWMKPIPDRRFDWCAVDDDTYDGPGSPIGHGRNEAEAVADLKDQLHDRMIDQMSDEEYARWNEELQRKSDAQENF
jgi:hypothetical protein